MGRRMTKKGRAFLRGHEGDVLKAYRCPAGRWTIGTGLTAASGVVRPRAGMRITREESNRLLTLALKRNYEPRVAKAMPGASSNAFDGGCSFDFNTGAIHKASWVKAWRDDQICPVIRKRLRAWKKGGGRVLPGLVRRRREEADVILLNKWPVGVSAVREPPKPADNRARFVVSLDAKEIAEIIKGFHRVGFGHGNGLTIAREAVVAFQRKYDLTPDGLIGRATLSTLQRELDARKKTVNGAGTAGAGGAVAGGNQVVAPSASDPTGLLGDQLVTWTGYAAMGAVAIYAVWQAWHYRDLIAARLGDRFPKITTKLRSF